MSANKYIEHLHILPEDDANAQLATGFQLELGGIALKQMQVLPSAGGWKAVMDAFCSSHAFEMEKYPKRLMLLLIDLDQQPARLQKVRDEIPDVLKDRVFIFGALDEPERLKVSLGLSLEEIGIRLAEECRNQTNATWSHEALRHNDLECQRLRASVSGWLLAP